MSIIDLYVPPEYENKEKVYQKFIKNIDTINKKT